ncbi:MAG: transcription elongation factor GreA [Lachnospiraceae bacterium]
MAEKKIITYAGLKKLEDELQDLKVVRRKEVAQKIKEAREQGDLSENAEYDAAKDEQRDIESRIEEIEKILKNVEVVDEDDIDLEKINIGCRVKLYDYEYDEEVEYRLVGSTEADILNNLISNESPIGVALIGQKVGTEIEVEGPDGIFKYRILEIQRSND